MWSGEPVPVGTVQTIVYLGPSTAGLRCNIGSGDWPKAAGKKPAVCVRSPPGVPPLPSYITLKVLTNPGPEIVPSDGPFASAVAGRARAAKAATTRVRRVMVRAPFGVCSGYTAWAPRVPASGASVGGGARELPRDLELLDGQH